MRLIVALAAVSLVASAGSASTIACRNAKGQAAKCGTAGAIPVAAKATPAAAAGGIKCKDGFTWKSATRKGACSGHKGIA